MSSTKQGNGFGRKKTERTLALLYNKVETSYGMKLLTETNLHLEMNLPKKKKECCIFKHI